MSLFVTLYDLRGIGKLVTLVFLSSRLSGNFTGSWLFSFRNNLLCCELFKTDPLAGVSLLAVPFINDPYIRLQYGYILYSNWTVLLLAIFHDKSVVVLISSWYIHKLV